MKKNNVLRLSFLFASAALSLASADLAEAKFFRRVRVTHSVELSRMTISQTSKPTITQIELLGALLVRAQSFEPGLAPGFSARSSISSLSSNPSEMSVRRLDVQSYVFYPALGSKWGLEPAFGGYYATSQSRGTTLGYKDLSGPFGMLTVLFSTTKSRLWSLHAGIYLILDGAKILSASEGNRQEYGLRYQILSPSGRGVRVGLISQSTVLGRAPSRAEMRSVGLEAGVSF